jgi:hypothetical protein
MKYRAPLMANAILHKTGHAVTAEEADVVVPSPQNTLLAPTF